ncbi:AMP-binding protein [Sphingomonas yunnanensis]|uniref:class I adenylate-forming enzyme family protein n=1 Tax=Sphingomonas yunnanensis TaxID=310400 RepID=UPI001CA6AAAC|nr:AMP-binding protein [Sphingomonas yunnanensis]MBY9061436.1 AMP-binding protein [Sphingomonas yunnanensis]
MAMGHGQETGWPARSHDEVRALLTAPGSAFEIETVTIRGVPTRTWKNAPPTLRALLEVSRAHGERLMTIYEDERVSYAAHARAVAALAAVLAEKGVRAGDRVAIAMRNLPEYPAALFAVTALGAVAVPLNAWWSGEELRYALDDSAARLLIVDAERHELLLPLYGLLRHLGDVLVTRASGTLARPAVALEALIGAPMRWEALPERPLPDTPLGPDDPAAIFYTSGTTGRPKGALGTHRNLTTNIMSSAYAAARTALRRGELPPPTTPRVVLTVIPLFHVTACSAALMGAVASGSTTIYMRRWDAVRAMELVERERVTVTGGVPTIAWQLLDHPERARFDLSSLESIAYGGAPAAPELARRLRAEFGVWPQNGWGMTETMATVTSLAAEDYLARPESAGLPVAVADVIVTDGEGAPLPPGAVGEVRARGPMVVAGYWNRPEASAETFVEGWVRTGDVGRLDEDGFLYILDRAKDVVIRGGENIYSIEIENVLEAHPAVSECAVLGAPHRVLGEEAVAVVRLTPAGSVDEAELQHWVRARLAAFKVPAEIRFTAEPLPRNANGKILKRELKGLFRERFAA